MHAVELVAAGPQLGANATWRGRPWSCTRVTPPTALPELDGTVDVVVANPPYIPADGRVRDREVLEHDPGMALWGEGRTASTSCGPSPAPRSACCAPAAGSSCEHADVQGPSVLKLLADQAGWSQLADHQDLAGRDRFASARKALDGESSDSSVQLC